MILTLLVLLTITASLSMYLASTPIMLGINILLMALLIAGTFATYMSSWYAFMLFLIYVGGMLVMFVYFLALSPNQQMSYSKIFPMSMMSLLTLTLVSYLMDMKTTNIDSFIQGNIMLYMTKNAPALMILALILLLAMIIVVKITNRSSGPLRPFNYV